MDPLTLIGIVVAFLVIIGSMVLEGGNPMSLVLIGPLILVFFGTFAVGAAGNSLPMFISSVKAAGGALLSKPPDYGDTLDTIIKCAEIARREGLLALEAKTASIQDELLRKGLELAIDGTDPGDLSSILEAEVHSNTVYANRQAKLFSDMGGYAPTIGIIGTVLGLVNVLGNLSSPEELGHLIAGAFVATLWGVLCANVMWLPIAAKLKLLADQRAVAGEVVIQGIMAIQAGSNPRMVDTKLRALLTPDALKTLDKAA